MACPVARQFRRAGRPVDSPTTVFRIPAFEFQPGAHALRRNVGRRPGPGRLTIQEPGCPMMPHWHQLPQKTVLAGLYRVGYLSVTSSLTAWERAKKGNSNEIRRVSRRKKGEKDEEN